MDEYQYDNQRFTPGAVHRMAGAEEAKVGDQRHQSVYVYNNEIRLAVDVALTTGRPLLVRGPSGIGKSSLARNAADVLGRRFYEKVITSRTQSRDLLWEVDLVRRLHDAHRAKENFPDGLAPYVVPGPLWWAFDRASAEWRGEKESTAGITRVADPAGGKPDAEAAVVLLDEIDKADPDVPNNLLVPLGSLSFVVDDTGRTVRCPPARAPLVIITTNDERELPKAFLRRCIELELPAPTRQRLIAIAHAHFPEHSTLLATVLAGLVGKSTSANLDEAVDLSPAEFIDILRACKEHGVRPDGPRPEVWEALKKLVVFKPGRRAP